MKKTIIATLTALSLSTFAQVGTVTTSEEIPESNSITDIGIMDPLFNNALVFYMNHGLTVFNQKFEYSLIDPKTYAEIKKIPLPVFKGFSLLSIRNHHELYNNRSQTIALKGNLVQFMTSGLGKKDAVSAVKIPESFTVPQAPEFLFPYSDAYSLLYFINDAKTICAFSHVEEFKKLKKKAFHYYVYDNNLKRLVNDSILYPAESKEQYKIYVYENGYAISKEDGLVTKVTISDLKTKKTFTLDYGTNKLYSVVEKIKQLPNNKIVILGLYYSETVKKVCKKGIRKTTLTLKNEIEEDIFFEHKAAGKQEQEDAAKIVASTFITDDGACFALIAQWTPYGTGKYELVCIENSKNTWKRQLPIPATGSNYEMLFSNGRLYMSYLDYEGNKNNYDYNNYVYGDPTPSTPVTERQNYKSNITLLRIDLTGGIRNQTVPDTFYKTILPYKGSFMCINQGLNGQVTSKCRFLKISLSN